MNVDQDEAMNVGLHGITAVAELKPP